MGHQISAGSMEIGYSLGANIVAGWCWKLSPPQKPKEMSNIEWRERNDGTTHIPEENVKITDSLVPKTYQEAKERGFTKDCRGEVNEEEFTRLRDFLSYAADNGHDIYGSY